jgi:cytoskeleton-associated protein 5
MLLGIGDSKPWIPTGCGFKEFFNGEMIADDHKPGNPALRIRLWTLFAEKLLHCHLRKYLRMDFLCLSQLYTILKDHNADVKKNVHEAVLSYMMHLGYTGCPRRRGQYSGRS